MAFGTNLQYLRKMKGGMTQEKLAEKMNVSRQTVSNWESGEGYPEMEKLIELCDFFSCKMDELVRQDMTSPEHIYSPITIKSMPAFNMARYVIISPDPETDVLGHMQEWMKKSGLKENAQNEPMLIGWDFPHVSQEQKNRFGLRGYCAACVLPDDFTSDIPGAEVVRQEAANYAVITITEPFIAPFASIPKAYQLLLDYLAESKIKTHFSETILPCFEHEYVKDGITYMDVYMQAGSAGTEASV